MSREIKNIKNRMMENDDENYSDNDDSRYENEEREYQSEMKEYKSQVVLDIQKALFKYTHDLPLCEYLHTSTIGQFISRIK